MSLVEIPDDLLLRLYTQRSADQENALMERIRAMEAHMTELSGQIAAQSQEITALSDRIGSLDAGPLLAQVAELQQAQADAEAARVALADAEASEDVLQDAERARLTNELDTASQNVTDLTAQVASASQDIASGIDGVRANTDRLAQLAQPAAPPAP